VEAFLLFLTIIDKEASGYKKYENNQTYTIIAQEQKSEEDEEKSQQDEEERNKEEGNEDIETIIREMEEQNQEELEPSLPYGFAEEEEERIEMLSLKGYFRTRIFLYSGLPQPENRSVRYIRPDFFQSRFRLEPTVNMSPSIRVSSQVDILDDIIWGAGLSGFSVSGEKICDKYNNGQNFEICDGQQRSIAVKRLWGEIDSVLSIPVKVKLGRQPVDFGLGAHLNDGNGFKNLWDDAHLGTTKDRISLSFPVSDLLDFNIGIDTQISEIISSGNLIDYFLVPRFKTSKISFQVYANAQRSPKTELYFFLPYISWLPSYNSSIEIEGGIFTGNIDYIPNFGNFSRYKVFAWNIAGRAKFETGLIRLILDAGYSSGDENPGDKTIKSIPMHPDYNIGFILYEDVVARYTGNIARELENSSGTKADFFASKGGVFGSYYIMPTIGFFPFESIGAYISNLWAFSNSLFFIDPRSGQQFFGRDAKKGLLGTEIDFGLRVGTENIEFGTEIGYLILGKSLRSSIPQGAKNTFKTQFRFTWMF